MGGVTKILVAVAVASAAVYVTNRYVLKPEGSDQGFVPISDGFGLDDIVQGAAIVGATWLAGKMLGKRAIG